MKLKKKERFIRYKSNEITKAKNQTPIKYNIKINKS